jgi:hypothetical protein
MKQFYTYIFRDPSRNSEPFYVGKGTGDRFKRHFSRSDKHPLTHRLQAMRRLSIEVSIEIINCIDAEHAFFVEECLIDVFGRKDLRTGPLLNLTAGGEGRRQWSAKMINEHKAKITGQKRSAETKLKMSISAKKVIRGARGPRPGIGGRKPGCEITDKHRAKLATAQTGKKQSEETKAKISATRKETERRKKLQTT